MIWRVAFKEILSTLRDRRAMVSSLLIPLLVLPAMMLGLPLALGGLFQREQTTITEIGALGANDLPPELASRIEQQNVRFRSVEDPEAAVLNGDVAVALAVPTGFAEALADGEAATLTIYSKAGNLKSELNASKVREAVDAYQKELVAQRLTAAGLDPGILAPITLTTVDASSKAERSSGQLSWLIPFFIAIWTLTGGQMTAIDATAGEKERGTLEVLLVAPIRRTEVVMGKFIATLTFGLGAAVMAIVGYVVGGAITRGLARPSLGGDAQDLVRVMGGALSIDAGSVVLLFVSALLLAGTVAALLLGLAMFARSYKEAQSYIAPLSFLFILPAVGLQFKDLIGFGASVYLIPVFNVLVVMDDIVRGTVELGNVLLTWATLLVVIVLLLAFAFRNFRRESVIFRV